MGYPEVPFCPVASYVGLMSLEPSSRLQDILFIFRIVNKLTVQHYSGEYIFMYLRERDQEIYLVDPAFHQLRDEQYSDEDSTAG
ncbi:hypothetical protein J6590_088010 [Homalodisca vitripennis]|nr:hypothetical protein J6590_088010 [Homalodisca vitripennis]